LGTGCVQAKKDEKPVEKQVQQTPPNKQTKQVENQVSKISEKTCEAMREKCSETNRKTGSPEAEIQFRSQKTC